MRNTREKLTIKQKIEIITYSDENKNPSSRKIAKFFGAKYGRSIHHS